MLFRSLEVLDRNGARGPKLPKLGPLQPVASYFVQLVTRFIVRNHQDRVIKAIKNLYIRRETQCAKDAVERHMLRRARIDAERIAPTLKKNPLGVPTFLLGGAFLSGILSFLGGAAQSAQSGKLALIIATVVLTLVTLGVSYVVLVGSAVARKRIKLTLDRPTRALWETIGACGQPPKDDAKQFALIAIILSGLGLLIVVIGLIFALVK